MPRKQTKKVKESYLERKWKKSGIAPLVEVDPLELTDKRLSPEEVVAKEREELMKMESKKRIHGQDQLEDADRSSGPRINHNDLIKRVQKLNPGIHVKPGKMSLPGVRDAALYVRKRSYEYNEVDFMSAAESARWGFTAPKDDFFIHHKYCGGFPMEPLAEWGHCTVDSSNVALHEVRGWRSVLMALIKAKAITYQQAIAEFGDPINDPRAQFWFEQMLPYLNH